MAVNKMWDYPRQAGIPLFCRAAPSHVDAIHFAAGGNQVYDIPADAKFLIFNGTVDFWVKRGGAAAVPGADILDGSSSELNPTSYAVEEGITQIGFAVGAAGVISIAVYSG